MELEQLIALLAQMGGNFNPSLMASAMPANNVSPANIASAMNPNVLLSSGLVDPSTIQNGIGSVYQQMLAEWESRNQVNLPPEASDLWLSPVTSKYSTNDEVSAFMNEMFAAIKNGTTTPERVKAAIASKDSLAPDAVKAAYSDISVDLDKYGKLAEAQAQAKLKFEITNAQNGVTTAPAPTLEQARFKFYKDLGAPEMALLPDAGVGYEFDPSLFADESRTKGLEGIIGRTRSRTDKSDAVDARKQQQFDRTSEKNKTDAARLAGEKARQAYLDANAKPDQITQILDYASRDRILGGLFGKDQTTERKNLADQAGKQAMLAELARLDRVPKVSVETPYNATSRLNAAARAGMANDVAYNQRVADLVAQKLAAAGRTPNQDAINQLLGYAATVNQKK
jgi:hypothetical protein